MSRILAVVALAFAVAACSSEPLPLAIAIVDCPSSGVAKGTAVTVAGHFTGNQKLTSESLTIDEGIKDATGAVVAPRVVTGATDTITVDADAIVAVTYKITTEEGAAVEAHCRYAVGSPLEVVVPEEEEEDIVDVGSGDNGGGDNGGGGDVVEEPGVPVDLNGNFALVAWDMPKMDGLPLNPNTQCASAKSVSFVHLTQTGKHIEMDVETCTLPMPSVFTFGYDRVDTTVPEAFRRALGTLHVGFDLRHGTVGDKFEPITEGGQDQFVGANVADGAALPQGAGAPGEVDSDGDSRPGGTIHVGGVDRTIAYRRAIDLFAGVVLNNDEIDGSAPGSWLVSTETALLDPELVLGFGAFNVGVRGEMSTFKMVRTNVSSCAELLADPASLPSPARPALPQGCAHFDPSDGPAFDGVSVVP